MREDAPRRRWVWVVGAAVLIGLFAINAGDEPEPSEAISECEDAFATAAAIDPMQDANEDLFPAVRACASVAEWTEASAQHPDALDGIDPETVLANLCLNYPAISSEPLCSQVP